MIDPAIKLVAIIGPTASGKSDLALALAQRYTGEIMCADSRTVYRGLDIGAAKPSPADRALIPHHLLDLVDPDQTLSVAAFKQAAEMAIGQITARKHVPFLVGGSGLYLDSILYDYQFPSEADYSLRAELDELSSDELLGRLQIVDPKAYGSIDMSNRRRVSRAIETAGQVRGRTNKLRGSTIVIGMAMNKEVIQQRIDLRIKNMLKEGFFDEVKVLGAKYGWDNEAMSGIGYRAFQAASEGRMTVDEAAKEFARGDMRLVKKQLTWFRRNKAIHWVSSQAEAEELVGNFLECAV